MGQGESNAVAKDVQILSLEEECAEGMGHITIQTINPLHLDQSSSRVLCNPDPMSMLLDLQSLEKEEESEGFLER